ncbi:DEAD/DEAH box helicase [bacterium]|nr:DEAD/DEAH box helicase [bacterium]
MENFQSLGLPMQLMHSLEQMQFNTPTPIQAQAIPLALEGKDILGSAQTGTGKTGAFGIPLVAHLLNKPRGSALVLTPTRELAVQVLEALEKMLGKYSPIKTALLIGGEPMPKQFQQLRARPRLIVGTPGRINDHLARGTLALHDAGFLVLDETDRMLDMGFGVQLEKIAKYLPKQRQTLMFSATMPGNIMQLSSKYLTDPVRITVGSTTAAAPKIQQEIIQTSEGDKYNHLIEQLNNREGSIIIFVKTKWGAEKMAIKLSRSGHSADAIHGDLRQNKRDRVIQSFRDKKHRIMVATDIAARGLDIPHIEHVINYDLPQAPEDYIHRIGRTARAGAEGSAICLITPQDGSKWRAIHKLMHPGEKLEGFSSGGNRSEGKRSGGRGRNGGGFKGNRQDGDARRPRRDDQPRDAQAPRGEGRNRKGDEFHAASDMPRTERPHKEQPKQNWAHDAARPRQERSERLEGGSDKPARFKPRGNGQSNTWTKGNSRGGNPRGQNRGFAA